MASNLFADAKKLRKQYPKMAWPMLVKKAAAMRRSGTKISGVKTAAKKAAPKKAARVKSVKVTRTKTKTVKLDGVGAIAARDLTKTMGEIGQCEKTIQGLKDKMKGTKGTERNAFTRMINEHKKFLAGLKQRKTIIKRSI